MILSASSGEMPGTLSSSALVALLSSTGLTSPVPALPCLRGRRTGFLAAGAPAGAGFWAGSTAGAAGVWVVPAGAWAQASRMAPAAAIPRMECFMKGSP